MKFVIHFAEVFGPRLSDGAKAVAFRQQNIDPIIGSNEELVFDFTNVTNANSSFMNALLGVLVREHGSGVLDKIEFKGCRPAIQVLINSALYLGLRAPQDSPLAVGSNTL